MKKFLLKVFFFIVSFGISLFIIFTTFKNIFEAKYLLFPYALHPFDIVSLYPDTWILLKKLYIISFSISYIILYNKFSNLIYSKFSTNKQKTNPISLLETSSFAYNVSFMAPVNANFFPTKGSSNLGHNIPGVSNNCKSFPALSHC